MHDPETQRQLPPDEMTYESAPRYELTSNLERVMADFAREMEAIDVDPAATFRMWDEVESKPSAKDTFLPKVWTDHPVVGYTNMDADDQVESA